MFTTQNLFIAFTVSSLMMWMLFAYRRLREKIDIIRFIDEKEDQSIKIMALAYSFYHVGIIFLCTFAITVIYKYQELIFAHMFLMVCLVIASLTVPAFFYFMSTAVGDLSEASTLFAVFQYCTYNIAQIRIKKKRWNVRVGSQRNTSKIPMRRRG